MDKDNSVVTADDEFFLGIEKQAQSGEKIVRFIVISSYDLLAVDFILYIILGSLSLTSMIIWIVSCIVYYNLYTGKVWAKWLYYISCTGSVFILAYLIKGLPNSLNTGIFAKELPGRPFLTAPFWIFVAIAVVRIVFCILLIRSKSVREFLYRQMTANKTFLRKV